MTAATDGGRGLLRAYWREVPHEVLMPRHSSAPPISDSNTRRRWGPAPAQFWVNGMFVAFGRAER